MVRRHPSARALGKGTRDPARASAVLDKASKSAAACALQQLSTARAYETSLLPTGIFPPARELIAWLDRVYRSRRRPGQGDPKALRNRTSVFRGRRAPFGACAHVDNDNTTEAGRLIEGRARGEPPPQWAARVCCGSKTKSALNSKSPGRFNRTTQSRSETAS